MVRRRPAQGIVLVLVVGFAALAALTGLALLETTAGSYAEAINAQASARARDLAASGVALAAHFLRVPPSQVTAGHHWHGVSGFSIDASNDTCDVTVVQLAAAPDTYQVTSVGSDRDADGTLIGRSSAATQVITPPPRSWSFTRAYYNATGDLSSGPRVTFTGDVFVHGDATGAGTCNGNIAATGSITWTGGGGPTLTPNADPLPLPVINVHSWRRYVIHGVVREAQTYSGATLTAIGVSALPDGNGALSIVSNWLALGATLVDPLGTHIGGIGGLGRFVVVAPSASGLRGSPIIGAGVVTHTNPGGVLFVDGDLGVGAITFFGTLVVNGNVTFMPGGVATLCALPMYPALVCTGDIDFGGANTEIRGPILCGGRLQGVSPNLSANGACLAYGLGLDATFAQSSNANFEYRAGFAALYDFSPGAFDPMTTVRWHE